MKPVRPPFVTRAILRRALPAEARDGIAGDLEERLQGDRSRWAYRRRAAGLVVRFTAERVRDGAAAVAATRLTALDFKLALRMLLRYPVLTIVGGAGLSLAIAVGAAVFAFLMIAVSPTIPLPDVNTALSVRLFDAAANKVDDRAVFDFLRWRQESSTLVAISATRTLSRNLTTADGRMDAVALAEVTGSTFDFLRLPIKGRPLNADDERPGAPRALVIGHALWQSRFGGSTDAIGQVVKVGDEPATVVGIMPDGIGFPEVAEAWTPWRLPAIDPAPKTGPDIQVWARLAPGKSLDDAKAEFALLGQRRRAAYPTQYAHVEPQLMTVSDAAAIHGPQAIAFQGLNIFVAMLLVLVSGNVALLMFARASTREAEILLRTALGASRFRIVVQFFSEALVLGGLSAGVGLWIAKRGLEWAIQMLVIGANEGSPLPYWIVGKLPPVSLVYAGALTLLAAVITGVLPALKVTRALSGRLRATSAGSGGLKFGGIWTAIIVTQIALTVVFPVTAFFVNRDSGQIESADIGVSPDHVLNVALSADRDQPQADFDAAVERIRQGVTQTAGVESATVANWLPLMAHSLVAIDIEGQAITRKDFGDDDYRVSEAAVDPAFFTTFEAGPLTGRVFGPSDMLHPAQFVVVNESFVRRLFHGQNPVGRRVKFAEIERGQGYQPLDAEPWREIIGVVRDLGMGYGPTTASSGVYVPLAPGSRRNYALAARVTGDPASIAPAVRALVRDLSPQTQLSSLTTLRAATASEIATVTFFFRMTMGVSLAALALSLTGIYAVMSFTVARRTREIGIRVALGSRPARVVLAVLRKPLWQVASGVLLGGLLSGVLVAFAYEGSVSALRLAIFVGYVLLMFAVCLLACFVPTRRALGIDPVEALRAD